MKTENQALVASSTRTILFCAALLGGPIAKYLIDRNQLQSTETDGRVVGLPFETNEPGEPSEQVVNHISLMRVLLVAHIAIIIGYFVNEAIAETGLKLPLFVPCLLVSILMSNTIPYLFPKLPWPARTRGTFAAAT